MCKRRSTFLPIPAYVRRMIAEWRRGAPTFRATAALTADKGYAAPHVAGEFKAAAANKTEIRGFSTMSESGISLSVAL